MGYKAMQVLLLLLLLGARVLGQREEDDRPPTSQSPDPPPSSPAATNVAIPASPPPSRTPFGNWTVVTNYTSERILVSANKKFEFNLTIIDQSSCVALVQHVPSSVIVWVANFDNRGPSVRGCSLIFDEDDLKLNDDRNDRIWNANPSDKRFDVLELDNRGCLLMKLDGETNSSWNSFDNPSDIIISEQRLLVNKEIWAASADYNYTKGNVVEMRVRPNAVGLVFDNGSNETPIYRANIIYYVVIDSGLRFMPENSTYKPTAFLYKRQALWEYARVTSAGELVIASYVDIVLPGGEYSICSGDDVCHCPDGFLPVHDASPAFACNRTAALRSVDCKDPADTFSNISGMFYSPYMTNDAKPNVTAAECKELCIKQCNCSMALYESRGAGTCYTSLGDLMQIHVQAAGTNETGNQTLFLRISSGRGSSNSSRRTAASAFAGAAGALVFVLLVLSVWYLYDSRRRLFEHADSGKWDSATTELLSRRRLQYFTYQELVESTGNFHQKLGSGGFSTVYAGQLPDDTKIAVKKLDVNEHKEREFLAAVSAVGSIWHSNLVPLLGHCTEGQHRLLVYELVNEGRSLDWYLWNSSVCFNAQTRRSIALESARGLAYLHEDCNVVHGDLKPENIVIDRSMHSRLVDFGFVGLMTPDQWINMARMRNAQVYMAPEWFKSQAIQEKTDVYSLGVVILELISGRRCLKQGASPEKYFLPTWGFALLSRGDNTVLELVDPRLDVDNLPATDREVLKGMIFVALWCVQDRASMRPPAKQVVRMLEGDASVDTPSPSPALDAFAREVFAGERAPESSNHSFTNSTSLSRTSDMLLRR